MEAFVYIILKIFLRSYSTSFFLPLFTDDGTSPSPEEKKLVQSASPGELSFYIFFMSSWGGGGGFPSISGVYVWAAQEGWFLGLFLVNKVEIFTLFGI